MMPIDKTPSRLCRIVESWLIDQQPASLPITTLRRHLTVCEHCRKVKNDLAHLHRALVVPPPNGLRPAPDILPALQRSLRTQRLSPAALAWQRLLHLLKRRVPLYQPVLAFAMLLLLYIAVQGPVQTPPERQQRFEALPQDSLLQRSDSLAPALVLQDSFAVIDGGDRGGKWHEDSALIRRRPLQR